MVLAIDAQQEQQCLQQLRQLGETAWVIGEIIERSGEPAVILA